MSPGDQLLNVFIDSVGVLLQAIVDSIFGAFVIPFLEAIAAAFGLM